MTTGRLKLFSLQSYDKYAAFYVFLYAQIGFK